jgi:alkylation response protein AidB-like acyl-CoA dehydrogenase
MTIFHANAEQLELIESFTRPLEELFPVARLHQNENSDYDQWVTAAEFGWFGISLPEATGGIELSVVEEALLFAKFGRHLISPGFMAASLAAKTASLAGNAELAQKILAGEIPVAVARQNADGAITLVDAEHAKLCLVVSAQGAALFPVEAITQRKLLDRTQWSIGLESAPAPGNPIAQAAAQDIGADINLLIAAQLTGIAAATLEMAVAYAQLRQQFGVAIGSFQAIKHYCTDMAMHVQAAKDTLSFAAVAMAEGRPDFRFQVASALVVAIRAAFFNTGKNIQIHGGMGFSAECDAHLFLKRAHVLETLAGGLKASRAALRAEDSIFGKDSALAG